MKNEVTIRIGGESGEGTISGGDILALAAARWGYYVYTFRTFPAEILGGPCLFQVRISDSPVKSMGDATDVLICLNKEAYDRNIGELRHGGVLIYDRAQRDPTLPDEEYGHAECHLDALWSSYGGNCPGSAIQTLQVA